MVNKEKVLSLWVFERRSIVDYDIYSQRENRPTESKIEQRWIKKVKPYSEADTEPLSQAEIIAPSTPNAWKMDLTMVEKEVQSETQELCPFRFHDY